MNGGAIIEPGRAGVREIPEPELSDTDVLVAIKQIGLCGTDLKSYRGENPFVAYPRIIGHETAGEVIRVGREVTEEITPGMRVTLYPYTNCGNCSSCLRGRVNCCRYNQTLGVQRDGAAAPLVTVPPEKIVSTSDLGWDEITLIEPLSVGAHAVRRGGVSAGSRVGVLGCGMIGLGVIMGAVRAGAEVIAIDIDDDKLRTAGVFGARHTINSASGDLSSQVESLTDGHGADIVIEAVGLPETFLSAFEIACFAGTVVYIGLAKKEVCYDVGQFILKEIDIRGSRNAMPEDFRNVISMLQEGDADTGPIVTQRYPLSELDQAMSYWVQNPGQVTKIILDRIAG